MRRLAEALGPALFVATLAGCGSSQLKLEKGFQQPPDSARPHTWWHWMNGNVTREGITADLEAMKQIGLGGAQIFNVSENIPDGPLRFMSPEWRALVKHAASEADRLGLELCVHNCAGWSSSGGPWITPEYAMQMVVFAETRATGPARYAAPLPQPLTRRGYYRDIAVLAFPKPREDGLRIREIRKKAGFEYQYGQQPQRDEFPPESIVERRNIVDLTAKLAADGRLTWDVPNGEWIILRIGYTPTGKDNHPAPQSGRGLECDKLSRRAFDVHWNGMMGPILRDLGPLAGKALNNALIDSYEVGSQTWSPRFREEFRQRRGYDPLRLLPALTGRVVDSGEVSERFLWDYRRTIADLFTDNYYDYFVQRCHASNLLASIEPYDGPFECLGAGREADIPMGEFWVGGGESESCKLAASVAHTYARRIVGAEAFTAEPSRGRWQNHPYALKSIGDLMYCAGVNRYIVHRYAHQPWLDRFPGMTMGQWGTHFERTNTWWTHGAAAWVSYLTRCQFLLQQGRFVADVCYFAGETAPNGAPYHRELKTKGYDYDACNADVILNRMSVRADRLVMPDGMSYRVLALPDTTFMTPRLLKKVRELVKSGATVIGPRPLQSPSLSDYPDGDAWVRRVAEEVWGDCDGTKVKEHTFGKGRVIWGRTVEDVLASMKVKPDCTFTGPGGGRPKMAWIHRVVGDVDVYFVSNQRPRGEDVECTFRVAGKRPEFWHADTGETEIAPVWREADGQTVVSIRFDPAGSVFVVFRRPGGDADHFVSIRPPVDSTRPPAPPKIEIRKAFYEAIDGAGGADVTAKVVELVSAGETSIPANNATFGDPAYMHLKRLRVEYALDGRAMTRLVEENGTLELVEAAAPTPSFPTYRLAAADPASVALTSFEPGAYEFRTAEGRTVNVEIGPVPPPVELDGPWTLRFQPNRGAPSSISLDKLTSWTAHPDAGVRYFSGTAEYETDFEIPPELLASAPAHQALYLDLGQVSCIAEVTLNGVDLGTWWKPPFSGDVTRVARPGKNILRVQVTNLWVNRLIGDEQHPDDCEWNVPVLKRWPDWLLEGRPRPTPQRLTFTTWKHYTRDSALLESGLLGPVVLRPAVRTMIK